VRKRPTKAKARQLSDAVIARRYLDLQKLRDEVSENEAAGQLNYSGYGPMLKSPHSVMCARRTRRSSGLLPLIFLHPSRMPNTTQITE